MNDDGPEQRFLKCLAGDDPVPAETVAIVVAHPDDETIGVGAQLPRMRGITLVQVTDGAPRTLDDATAHGFATAEAYATARRLELETALAIADVPCEALVNFAVPDQDAAFQLVTLARRLAGLFGKRGIDIVLTHAYEGGHPDHDAVAFAAHQACRLLQRQATGQRPALIEMPFYHADPSGWVTQRFIPDPDRPELAIWLGENERRLKEHMVAAHRTQRRTLAAFSLEFERYRPAPCYDFATLPNRGDLLYERYAWGLTGPRWQELACAALAALQQETA